MTVITDTPEWAALRKHFDAIRDVHLRRLFADEPGRASGRVEGRRAPVQVELKVKRHIQ